MKHYLELASLSAKVRRKQNRMSIFCIVLAVFLVTAIFGMADMYIRSQLLQAGPQSRRHQASSDRYCPGPSHAGASRKNLFLLTGSFSLSIILFLSFSVAVDFMNHSLTPLRPWTTDISIISPAQP